MVAVGEFGERRDTPETDDLVQPKSISRNAGRNSVLMRGAEGNPRVMSWRARVLFTLCVKVTQPIGPAAERQDRDHRARGEEWTERNSDAATHAPDHHEPAGLLRQVRVGVGTLLVARVRA